MFGYSYDVCLLQSDRRGFHAALSAKTKLGEILENPFVFQGIRDDAQELAGEGHNPSAGSAPSTDLLVKPIQVGASVL
jgi:hypothetical protein